MHVLTLKSLTDVLVCSKGFEQLVKNKDAHVKILATPKRELLGK